MHVWGEGASEGLMGGVGTGRVLIIHDKEVGLETMQVAAPIAAGDVKGRQARGQGGCRQGRRVISRVRLMQVGCETCKGACRPEGSVTEGEG